MDLILLLGWLVVGLFTPTIVNRFKPMLIRSVRFLAAYITVFLMGISVIVWMSIKNMGIFLVCGIASVWMGLQILLLPKIAPNVVDKLGLKW